MNAIGFDWRIEEESIPLAMDEDSFGAESKPAGGRTTRSSSKAEAEAIANALALANANAPNLSVLSKTAKERGKYKTFKTRIADLRAYKAKHGHCNVSANEDASLAQFCANARHSKVYHM